MWDKRYGGLDADQMRSFQQTRDGGYILGGFTTSGIGGDKSQPLWGSYDFWVVKTNQVGDLEWEKRYGGINGDALWSLRQSSDGGYVLGGHSTSGISGDKTQPTWSTGNPDFWILKIDSLGSIHWDKDFGGTGDDWFYSIDKTYDGGYILGGSSNSEISGDKTEPNRDTSSIHSMDYWIVKVDSIGNKEWDKTFGGSNEEELKTVKQTIDGGYIIGGWSRSDISGDKTQPLKGALGDYDFWIVKIDSVGNKIWDRDIGSTDPDLLWSIQLTDDGGLLLGGDAYIGVSGDKTQTGAGMYDYWIVKIDSAGNILWDKTFGGSSSEEFSGIQKTNSGGFLLSGDSYSTISGEKTENNLGSEQTWIVKIDSAGNKIWDKTIFTIGHDELGFAIENLEGCLVAGNWINVGIGGYKTQPNWGDYDFWIIKLCDSSAIPVSAFAATSQVCPGVCINYNNLTLYASSYQWFFPGASPDTSTSNNPTNICYYAPGSYSVTLIASNANGSDTLTLQNYITVFPQPPAQSILQSGDTLFAITGSSSYQWYFNGNSISGATDYFYVATASGDYNVVVMDSNGCEVEAVINNVIAAVGSGSMQSIQVYPNPVSETLGILGLESNSADELKIFNVFGEKVFTAVNCKLQIVNCQLSSGLYYLEITSDKKIYRTKFIKTTYQ